MGFAWVVPEVLYIFGFDEVADFAMDHSGSSLELDMIHVTLMVFFMSRIFLDEGIYHRNVVGINKNWEYDNFGGSNIGRKIFS